MEDKEHIEGTDEDVEGHRRRKLVKQTEEQSDDAEEPEDDVEGHVVQPPKAL
jgi:hypothetical protein